MAFKLKHRSDVRYYVLELDDDRFHRHTLLMVEFTQRDIFSPLAGNESRPLFKDGKRAGVELRFCLNILVADEYEERMRGRTTREHLATTPADIIRRFSPRSVQVA